MSEKPARLGIILAFAAVYVVWGSTYLAIKWAVETLPPMLMASTRFLAAGAMLYAFARLRGAAAPTREAWRNTGIIGTLLLVFGNGLVCWAAQYVASGMTALIICVVPLYMALLDWLVFKGERPDRRIVAGLIAGFIGVILLVKPDSFVKDGQLPGAIALLVAAFSWSSGSLLARKITLPKSAALATAMEMLVGGGVLLVVGLLRGEWADVHVEQATLRSVASLLYLVVFGSLIGFSAYVWLLKVVSPSAVSTYAFVNPCVAVFFGWAFADEVIDSRVMVAATLIVGAVVLITTRRRRPRPLPPAADTR